jgi:hypothetical protein
LHGTKPFDVSDGTTPDDLGRRRGGWPTSTERWLFHLDCLEDFVSRRLKAQEYVGGHVGARLKRCLDEEAARNERTTAAQIRLILRERYFERGVDSCEYGATTRQP